MRSFGMVLSKRQVTEEPPAKLFRDGIEDVQFKARKRIVSECFSAPYLNSCPGSSPKSPRSKYSSLILDL